MTVTVEPTEAPDFALLASGAAIAGMTGYFYPLVPPAGGTDLQRSVYDEERGLNIWCYARQDRATTAPGILFVHGGAWAAGEPTFHLRHMHQLAAKGYVTAALQYRFSVTDPWPAQIDDVTNALAWMRANAAALGLDPARLAVGGGSAGGHLASMAALTDPAHVKAAVVWYPAVDLRSFHRHPDFRGMTDLLMPGGDEEALLAASPIAHVGAESPPFLTLTGDLDGVTTLADITVFHELLDDAGVRNELVVFKGRDHGFDYHPTDFEVCLGRMGDFLDDVL